MKKRILCLITVLTIMVSLIPSVFAANHSIYDVVYFRDYDEHTSTSSDFGVNNGALRGLRNSYVVFKDVNFGTVSPASIIFDVGADSGEIFRMQVRLDSPTGPMILETEFEDTNWIFKKQEMYFKTEVTGKHDLYFINTGGGTANLVSFSFVKPPVKIDPFPEYPVRDLFDDIADNKYKDKINLVSSLGLTDWVKQGEHYEPDFGITRGDFARSIFKIFSEESDKKVAEQPFDDVSVDDVFAEAIFYLKERGIIKGNDDNTFRPYDYISVEDAAVIICRMLGYEPIADLSGGYMAGYLPIATEEGILKGLDTNENLQRDAFAQIMYNAIHANYMDLDAISKTQGLTYNKVAGILSSTKDIYCSEIYIEETTYTGIFSPDSSLPSKSVRSGDEIYNTGNSGAEAYVGMTCTAYWQEVDGDKNILFITPKRANNVYYASTWEGNEIVIDGNTVTVIDENGKTKDMDISGHAIIYNGKRLDSVFSDELKETMKTSFRGSVRIVEGEKTPVTFIEQYEDILIQAVDQNNKTFYNRLTNTSIGSPDTEVSITLNGEPVGIERVTAAMTGSYYESINTTGKKLVRILLNNSKISGTITRTSGDDIQIDGEDYKKSPNLSSIVQLGASATFFVNAYGEILFIDTVNLEDYNIGVFLDYKNVTDEDKFYLKLVNANGETVLYECAESVTADGVRVKKVALLEDGVAEFDGFKLVDKGSVILYKINENNIITAVDTYLEGTGKLNDTLVRRSDPDTQLRYNKNVGVLYYSNQALYPVTTDAVVINYMPEVDTNQYSFSNAGSMTKDANMKFTVYTTNKDSFMNDILLIKAGFKVRTGWSTPVIYQGRTEEMNENDELGYNIVAYGNSGYSEFFATAESVNNLENKYLYNFMRNVTLGDWVQFKLDSNKNVIDARILYKVDGSAEVPYYDTLNDEKPRISQAVPTTGSYSGDRFIYGRIVDVKDGFIRITTATGDEYISTDSQNIALWGINNGKILFNNRSTKESILIGNEVLVYVYNGKPTQILVKSL